MKRSKVKNNIQLRRKGRTRARVRATGIPRLSIFRSNTNLYAQIIDDAKGATLAAASLKEVGAPSAHPKEMTARVSKAFSLGKEIAEKAKKAGITHVVFDRGEYAYHGRVKALADGAREGGLKF